MQRAVSTKRSGAPLAIFSRGACAGCAQSGIGVKEGLAMRTSLGMRRREIIAIGTVTAAMLIISPPARAEFECRLVGRQAYTFTSDTVEWSMIIVAGQSCVRGIRSFDATIDDIQLVTAPQSGQVTLQGTAFYYRAAPNFQGTDAFTLSISGKRLTVSGKSTIRVMISIR